MRERELLSQTDAVNIGRQLHVPVHAGAEENVEKGFVRLIPEGVPPKDDGRKACEQQRRQEPPEKR
jgi:hypothetical protein